MYNGSEGITHAATQRPPRYIIHIFTEGGWRNYSGFSAGTQKTRHPRLCGDDEFFGLMDKSGLIIAFGHVPLLSSALGLGLGPDWAPATLSSPAVFVPGVATLVPAAHAHAVHHLAAASDPGMPGL